MDLFIKNLGRGIPMGGFPINVSSLGEEVVREFRHLRRWNKIQDADAMKEGATWQEKLRLERSLVYSEVLPPTYLQEWLEGVKLKDEDNAVLDEVNCEIEAIQASYARP